MTEPTLAEHAETAGYMVFELGAAGTILCLIGGVAIGWNDGSWQPTQAWFSYPLAVTVAGALIGSVGGICQPGRRRARANDIDMASPLRNTEAVVSSADTIASDRPLRPAVSAFRPAPRPTLRRGFAERA